MTRAAVHWEVIAVVGNGDALLDANGFAQRCGHRHATDLEAVRCPWVPTPWPDICDLLVRQFRTPELDVNPRTGLRRGRAEQGRLPL